MKLIKTMIVFALFAFISVTAQNKIDYSKEPGYFDYMQYTSLKPNDASTEVYLEEPLLKMVSKMAEDKKEGVGKIIAGLKLVRVNEFKVEKNELDNVSAAFENIGKELTSKKWDRIIKMKQVSNMVNVYVKPVDGVYGGLLVTMLDKNGKATFVNIVGSIDLDTLGKLSEELKLPGLNKLKEKE